MNTDDAFKVESEYTCAAIKTSLTLKEWWTQSNSNEEHLSWFAHILVVRLQACFPCKHSTVALKRERMWKSYFNLRTSNKFVSDWQDFILQSIGMKAFPAFYQFVTDQMFNELIKVEFTILSEDDTESFIRPLTEEELCAVRYVAGYVIRNIHEKTNLSSHPAKLDMIFLLTELAGDGISNNSDSEKWVDGINRGGLWTISDQTYNVFLTIEDLIRKHFSLALNKIEGASTCIQAILCNNDLLFEWCIIAAEVEEEVSKLVLEKIVSLYVTVRGFGFASSCLELYKQAQQKTTSKTRALRSELCPKQ